MPNLAVNPEEQALHDQALEMYCTMPVVAIRRISQTLRIKRELIDRWKDEENWLKLRTDRLQRSKAEKIKKVGSREDNAIAQINLARAMRKVLTDDLKRYSDNKSPHKDTKDVGDMVESLKKIDAIIDRNYAILEGK